MKKLFKIVIVFSLILSLFSLTGCGGKEESATFKTSKNGVDMTITFHAIGDEIDNIHQESVIDISNYSSSQIKIIEEASDDYEAKFSKIDGVTYSAKRDGNKTITEIIDIKLNEDNLQELMSSNLLPVTGNDVKKLSLEKTIEQFENQGIERVE